MRRPLFLLLGHANAQTANESEADAVAAIKEMGGRVGFDEHKLVVRVYFSGGSNANDAGLVHLKGLTNLQWLALAGDNVSDAGLKHLGGLTNLESLNLHGTQVTDAGLERLKGLTNLQRLNLTETQVTDAGLEHLRGLRNLRELNLRGRTKRQGSAAVPQMLWARSVPEPKMPCLC